jgi:ribonucleotide reductase beta subunit family protein with ferritin-like domain
LGSLIGVFSSLWPLHWKRYRDTYFPNPFIIRDALIHSKGTFAVIQEASIVIKNEFQIDVEQLIRKSKKRIVNRTIKFSKKQCNHLSSIRYQPVKYIRIFIYDSDLRIRNLRFSGLIPELIATIEVNTVVLPIL